MLTIFFRINLPYGIVKNEDDEWMAFNREYISLGYNNDESKLLTAHNQTYVSLPKKH